MYLHSLALFLSLSFLASSVSAASSYPSDFVDPDYILAGNFAAYTQLAQSTIAQWAEEFSETGPWTVTSKPFPAPSGDSHDYMSFSPYWWPNCSNVGNTTELTTEEIWRQCPYEPRDGQFNPDARIVNDVGQFSNLSDAVLLNSMAWALNGKGSNVYSLNNVKFLQTWFLDSETRMNPNLNYAQMQRGPDGQNGTHTGILDLKGMAKIASGILIMRKGNCPDWTEALDNQMNEWISEYIGWIESAPIALEEAASANNHGSYYFTQLAALKLIVNDSAGAVNVSKTYFDGIYQAQIESNGEQPLEAARTRPYHYRAYNLAAMVTNARMAQYAGSDVNFWNLTASQGAGIKDALDFAMTIPASESGEEKYAAELHPPMAGVAAIYGDPEGKYEAYLKEADPQFTTEPYFLWCQPFAAFEVSSADTNGQNNADSEDAEGGGNGALSDLALSYSHTAYASMFSLLFLML